jgi:hypothetical protein
MTTISLHYFIINLIINRLKICQIIELYKNTDDDALAYALLATIETLENIYNHTNSNSFKNKLYIGYAKNTQNINTSVSSGIMCNISKNNEIIGFLNCGTGGIKYQLYQNINNVIKVIKEDKPICSSFSQLFINKLYEPKNSINKNILKKEIQKTLNDIKWDKNIPIYSFITGDIRKVWENSSKLIKKIFEKEVINIFQSNNIKPCGDSYFISQDNEGLYENYAVTNLYKFMSPTFIPIINFGIGRGSSQWTTLFLNNNIITTGHKFGMNTPSFIAGPDNTISNTVIKLFNDHSYIDNITAFCNNQNGTNIIALKSGCLILVEKNKELSNLLFSEPNNSFTTMNTDILSILIKLIEKHTDN